MFGDNEPRRCLLKNHCDPRIVIDEVAKTTDHSVYG
jgi:hypothetical protein